MKKISFKKSFCLTKNIYLKLVSQKDAKFIFKLRTNKKLGKYLNPTSSDYKDQIIWMKKYQIRNNKKQEYYFKFQVKKNNKYNDIGVARIIKLTKNSFSFGSWIMKPKSEIWYAMECALAIDKFAFEIIGFNKNIMWMDKRNKKVISFHKITGAKEFKKDAKQIYAYLNKKMYFKLKKKFFYFYK